MINDKDATILIVDDDPFIVDYLSKLLEGYNYKLITSNNALTAMEILMQEEIDIVLTDIRMPGINGLSLLEKIHQFNTDIPVILMTGYIELSHTIDAIQKQAFDFITKPFKPDRLISSVEKAIRHRRAIDMEKKYKSMLEDAVKKRTEELTIALADLKNLNTEVILRLAMAAEFRDNDSAAHFSRISSYVKKIAETMGFDGDFIEIITLACKLHDIGKIGIPDSILLKPGPLTPKEWLVMKSHTTIGGKILSDSKYEILQIGASIALHHHERWDGSGYPYGKKGSDIPIESRIVILCDQYDAIRSKRPYKDVISHTETVKILTEGDGRTEPNHFDPDVLDAFTKISGDFDKIFEIYQD